MKQKVIFQKGKWFGDSKVEFPAAIDADAFCVLLNTSFGNRLEDRELSRENNIVKVSSALVDSEVVLLALRAFLYDNPHLDYQITYLDKRF